MLSSSHPAWRRESLIYFSTCAACSPFTILFLSYIHTLASCFVTVKKREHADKRTTGCVFAFLYKTRPPKYLLLYRDDNNVNLSWEWSDISIIIIYMSSYNFDSALGLYMSADWFYYTNFAYLFKLKNIRDLMHESLLNSYHIIKLYMIHSYIISNYQWYIVI